MYECVCVWGCVCVCECVCVIVCLKMVLLFIDTFLQQNLLAWEISQQFKHYNPFTYKIKILLSTNAGI